MDKRKRKMLVSKCTITMCPFCTARAVTEVDEVVEVLIEESSQILYYSNGQKLIKIR